MYSVRLSDRHPWRDNLVSWHDYHITPERHGHHQQLLAHVLDYLTGADA
ncbi:hypothetical protein [Candidatus Williamhamiltonella defendens]|nr:hypothetical protein [Candidatus Hamiltonella defensa]